MLTVASAVEKLIAKARPLANDRRRAGLESVPVTEALGRVLAGVGSVGLRGTLGGS